MCALAGDGQTVEYHELHTFSQQESWFHHDCFLDSHYMGRNRRFVILILSGLLFLTMALVLTGITFTAICIERGNYNGAVWAFFLGAVSCGTSTLFILHLRMKLEDWHDKRSLEGIKLFSLIMGFLSGGALGVYLVVGFVLQKDFTLDGLNYFSSSIFSGMCLAASMFLYFVAEWYKNAFELLESAMNVDLQRVNGPSTKTT